MNYENTPFINPYFDYGFKRLFGIEPNKDLLISFLNAVFEGRRPPIVDVSYLKTELLGYYRDRSVMFDLDCLQEDGSRYIVEIQKSDQYSFMDRRVFYAAGAVKEQAPKGPWNYRLNEVVVVGLLNFEFPNKEYPEDSYFHEAKILDSEDHHVLYEKLVFYYLELPKFKKPVSELETMMDKWLYAITRIAHLERRPEVLDAPVFEKFFEEARVSNLSKAERVLYEESMRYNWDLYSTMETSHGKGKEEGFAEGYEQGLAVGREQGLAVGREQGRQEEKLAMARTMKTLNIPLDTIIQVTGLSPDELHLL